MFNKFFERHPKFVIDSKPSKAKIDDYHGKLPADILFFWETYGFGTFMDGYLKVVDPEYFQEFLEQTYAPAATPSTVFAVTAFGDILVWEKEYVNQINYRMGSEKTQGKKISNLFNIFFINWDTVEKALSAKNYLAAVERLGECAYDECYAYTPALALGGAEKVENLQKVKLREHMMILSGLVGIIE
jgi:hypothetical protein